MFPESGGAVRYGYYSHGSLVGFVAGWAAWIAIASVIPVEAEASVQYMSSWPWSWAQGLYMHAAHGHGELTVPGLWICAVLVVLYFLVNFWSVKVFAGTNSAITFFKLIVPAATAIAMMCTGFHAENFHVGLHGGAYAGNLASILDRGRDIRHRVQLQRIPEPGKPGRRGAKSGPQHPPRDLRIAGDQHRGVPLAADRIPRCGRAGSSARGLVGARVQLPVRAARSCLQSQLAGAAPVCRCVRQPERNRDHLHRNDGPDDLRHGAQRLAAADLRPRAPPLRHSAARDVVQLCWLRSCSCSSSAAGGSSRKSSRSPPSSPIWWCR